MKEEHDYDYEKHDFRIIYFYLGFIIMAGSVIIVSLIFGL